MSLLDEPECDIEEVEGQSCTCIRDVSHPVCAQQASPLEYERHRCRPTRSHRVLHAASYFSRWQPRAAHRPGQITPGVTHAHKLVMCM